MSTELLTVGQSPVDLLARIQPAGGRCRDYRLQNADLHLRIYYAMQAARPEPGGGSKTYYLQPGDVRTFPVGVGPVWVWSYGNATAAVSAV